MTYRPLTGHLRTRYPVKAHLTKRIVATAQPKERPYELRDTTVRGLLLRVQPSGHKAWIIEWSRGKRRTLGPLGHLTLDQARAHASTAMAEVIQLGLPSIAKTKLASCTLRTLLSDYYSPWATTELRSGGRSVQMIETAFADQLDLPLTNIDGMLIDKWWRGRLLANSTRTNKPVSKRRSPGTLLP